MGGAIYVGAIPAAHEVLTDEACRELIHRAQQGDKAARAQLTECNVRLVMSVVHRFTGRGAEQEDLFQIGMLGLLKAIDHFDLSFSVCFSTYAVPVVMGEMRRYLRDNSSVHVSRSVKELAYQAVQLKERLEKEWEREPTIAQLAKGLGRTKEDVIFALESLRPTVSMHEQVGENRDGSAAELWEKLPDGAADSDVWLEKITMEQCLTLLSPKERWVYEKRYRLGLTQQEIAAQLGLSQAQISRLEKKVLMKMKDFYDERATG